MTVRTSSRPSFYNPCLTVCLFAFINTTAHAQLFRFLNIPSSARMAALGGVNVSLADRDPNFFVTNASLNADTTTGFASASYQFYVADVGLASFSFRPHIHSLGALNVGIQHINYGTQDAYDPTGAALGEFRSGETALLLGKQFQSGAFRVGVNTKAVFSNLAGFRSAALAFDLGGLYIHPVKDLSIGLAIKNLGVVLTDFVENSSSQLPFDVQLGTTFKPQHMPVRFTFTLFDLTDYVVYETASDRPSAVDKAMRHVNAAAEFLLSKNVNMLAGYNFRKRQELRVNELSSGAGLSLGFSVCIKKMELVMSRTSFGPQQAIYGFSLNTSIHQLILKREKI